MALNPFRYIFRINYSQISMKHELCRCLKNCRQRKRGKSNAEISSNFR